MAFSMTSFLAGGGAVFTAIVMGFAGGAMLTSSAVEQPNRFERVAASPPMRTPTTVAKVETPEVPSTSPAKEPAAQPAAVKNETPEPAQPPDRVVPLAQGKSQGAVPPQAGPATAPDETAAQSETVKKGRDSEPRRDATSKKSERYAQRHRDRRIRRDFESRSIEAAANAIRQMPRDDGPRQMLRDDGPQEVILRRNDGPRFGFFGDD